MGLASNAAGGVAGAIYLAGDRDEENRQEGKVKKCHFDPPSA